jgi:hypothetical protein
MAQRLAKKFGAAKENRAPVAGFVFQDGGPTGNVMTAVDCRGVPIFDFAYRPHEIGKRNISKEGLFLC